MVSYAPRHGLGPDDGVVSTHASREDVAEFMMAQLGERTHVGAFPGVTSAW